MKKKKKNHQLQYDALEHQVLCFPSAMVLHIRLEYKTHTLK